MSFTFRVTQISVADQETILTGHMISGELTWRQTIEVQEDGITVLSAPLRGVVVIDHSNENTLLALDPSCWGSILPLPMRPDNDRRIRLILAGTPAHPISVPAMAIGVDEMALLPSELQTAVRSAEAASSFHASPYPSAPVKMTPSLGTPVREYPYQVSRRGMLHFAPWSLLATIALLVALYVAAVSKGQWLGGDLKWLLCSMIGLIDCFFLYFSLQMLLAKPAHITVTTNGIVLPVIMPNFSSQDVFVPFGEIDDMLEHWQNDSLRLIKLKTASANYDVNRLLMEPSHAEELRRLLWQHLNPRRRPHSRGRG
jgi:hypothetical protein